MKKIKIVHFLFGLVNGGVEKVLINYFSNFDRNKYDLYIVTQQVEEKCQKDFEKLGFKVYIVPEKHHIIKYFKEVNKILRTIKPDIIHSHMAETNFIPNFIALINGVKVRISHSHNYYPYHSLKRKICLRISMVVSNKYLACSKDAAIYAFGKKNINNVEIINNAFDLSLFKFNNDRRNKIRKELNINNNDKVILNIGRMVDQKNQLFLIDIFNELLKENNNFKLILIGNGILKDKIFEKIDLYGISNNILYFDKTNDVSSFLSASDLFLFPTKFEGLGIVLVEAQTSGIQILTSDIVPSEAIICDLCSTFSLNNNPMQWKEKCLELLLKTNDRVNYYDILYNSNFNIYKEHYKLESIYNEEIKKYEKK